MLTGILRKNKYNGQIVYKKCDMKVSVIVPVYNMEITVSRCLDSIVGQDYKDFEVILINDGSNDKSPEICILDIFLERIKDCHTLLKRG